MINEATQGRISWQSVRLADICFQERKIVEPGSEEAKRLRYLSLEHVESETGQILEVPEDAPEDQGKSTTFLFDENHVLYGKLRPYLNKVSLPSFQGRCTTEIIPLRPREGTDRNFLAWLLRRPETVRWAMAGKTGSRMPRADMDALLNMSVALPPLKEQERIAATLNEQMAVVKQTRTTVSQQLSSAQLLANRELASAFDAPVARCWPKVRLGSIAKTASGSTPSRSEPRYFAGSIPWVKTTELTDSFILDTEEHVTEAALQETSLSLLPEGTLLVAMYGQGQTRGRTGLLGVPATTNQACFAVLPNRSAFDSLYLQLWFRANYPAIRALSEGRGGNQSNLNGDILRDLEIPFPDLTEQTRLAEELTLRLSCTAKLERHVEQQLQSVESLPPALLRSAFSGAL